MPSERIQRRIEAFLDEADAAASAGDWAVVAEKARAVLAIDEANDDAQAFLKMVDGAAGGMPRGTAPAGAPAVPALPASFFSGRYRVLRLLGEGGKKRVYLARDERLQRDVAFALVRTEGVDSLGRERILREAQHMGRVGAHPNLVTVHDIGEEDGNPCIVQEFMGGGDVATLLAQGTPAVVRTLAIAADVLQGLSFMHGQGIVHRDLKPANVFLAADGTAKVGDFGLAIAGDLSRLTQHGTLVGTVAYMPPEQAVGGEVSARSDLYSLGAMLYEMITGRPPFQGDDATAVISQHLNTAPVAPSWHTEDCPPPLEALILRMLEKDPAKRPASAAEVAAALAVIDPDEKSSRHSTENPLAGLARGVFVGREKEMERLRKAFDEAFAGRGSLAMLVGEPGIGKTRAAQELETYARMRGAQVLWGRSHEASGAPPYWPWVQVGRQWGGANDLASIQAEVAPTRGELVRLFPELRQQPGFVEPEAVLDPQSAQFRLFDAFATYLRAMAGKGPLVVALDDLHWADKPTLLLLEHVARDLGRLRLLVVCTYRDTDLSRTHPLSEALAALNRDPGFQRVVLRGLSKDEVRAYIREAAHAEPKPAVLEKIFEETEGNPFFLSEVVNLLTQEGTLNRESVSDIAVPDGVKEALGRRLDRLSKEANELLQVAAIAGREFAYDTLSLLGERDEDALLRLIEEGIEARVIEEMEQPGRYRFTHALMQETLLSELSTTRRVRLHGQVGEALELRWGDRAEEYASRLASHFLESSTLTPRHADKARQYAVLAAREAEQKFAWAEAVRWYEAAIAGDEDPEPGVLTALSFGWEFAEERSERSWPIFERALEAYRMRRDVDGFALAVARAPHFVAHASAMYPLVAEAVAQPNTLTSALNLHLRIQLRRADYQSRNDARSVVGPPDLEEQILQLSHVVGGAEGAAARYEVAAMRHLRSGDLATTARNFDDAANECEAAGGADEASYFRIAAAYVAIAGGHLQEASRLSHELRRLSLERGIRSGIAFAAEFLTAVATLRWDLDEIERLIDRARVEAGHWRDPEDFRMIVRVFQGKNPEGWDAALSRGLPAAPQFRIMQMAWASAASAYAGETRASEERFAEWWVLWAVGAGGSPQRAESLVWIALALPHISVQDHILRQIYEETRQWKNWCAFDSGIGIDPARGQLALRLGLVDEAEQAFNDGLEWAEREDCPVELGRNLQGLAAVAESRGDIAGALTLLDRAAGQYQPRGVKLFLDQVIAAKVRLQGITSTYRSSIENVAAAVQGERLAVSEHAAADGTVTLFFSDIEGSTAMNERLGDARWLEVLHAHNTILDGAIQAHGGRTVKTMGDGYMAVFASPEAGVRCALAIQAAFQVPREVLTDVRVRIGIHTGQAVRDQGDFFGREVNYAARVANAAIGGEVVVSEAVRERILGAAGLLISPPSDVEFKGFSGEQPVFRVVAAG